MIDCDHLCICFCGCDFKYCTLAHGPGHRRHIGKQWRTSNAVLRFCLLRSNGTLKRCQQNALARPHFMIICDQRIRRGNRTPRSGSRSQDLIRYTSIYYVNVIQSWNAILQLFGVAKCIDGVRQCLRTVKNSADVESNFTSVERLQLVLHGVVLDIQDEFSGHGSKLS